MYMIYKHHLKIYIFLIGHAEFWTLLKELYDQPDKSKKILRKFGKILEKNGFLPWVREKLENKEKLKKDAKRIIIIDNK